MKKEHHNAELENQNIVDQDTQELENMLEEASKEAQEAEISPLIAKIAQGRLWYFAETNWSKDRKCQSWCKNKNSKKADSSARKPQKVASQSQWWAKGKYYGKGAFDDARGILQSIEWDGNWTDSIDWARARCTVSWASKYATSNWW